MIRQMYLRGVSNPKFWISHCNGWWLPYRWYKSDNIFHYIESGTYGHAKLGKLNSRNIFSLVLWETVSMLHAPSVYPMMSYDHNIHMIMIHHLFVRFLHPNYILFCLIFILICFPWWYCFRYIYRNFWDKAWTIIQFF